MSILIHYLSTLSNTALWLIQLIFCYGTLLIALRFFGKSGVMCIMPIMMVAANIQVLKAIYVPFMHEPIPLGTIFISTNYLACDILAEYYGNREAQKAIILTLFGFMVMSMCMLLTICFHTITPFVALQSGIIGQQSIQEAMKTLFIPGLSFFLCSIISFYISQKTEVSAFFFIKKMTGNKHLWLRNNISTWVASLMDNVLFNILAFRLFTHNPVPWPTLIGSYILGTYALRIAIATCDTPFMYLAKYIPHKHQVNRTHAMKS